MSLISIVHEFTILYSSRVLQKDKKWSDGRFRFYELNNKLEVLSNDMLLVGTDFYPHHARKPLESGIFAEGNDYLLPSGKLIVEFNEYLGSFKRDLSNIFVKKDVAVKTIPGAQVGTKQPGIVSITSRKIGKAMNSTNSLVKKEHTDLGNVVMPPLGRLKPISSRPIGLRRASKPHEKSFERIQQVEASITQKLDKYYLSTSRTNTRIPSGSNRLSKRLKLMTGLFLADKFSSAHTDHGLTAFSGTEHEPFPRNIDTDSEFF